MLLLRFARRISALTLLLAAGIAAAAAVPSQAGASAPEAGDDDHGALIGDLVFHADLLSALDRLCPPRHHNRGAATDWHGALRPLLDEAFTPELRALSRRLGADAGAQLVQQRGGCHTRGYTAAYNESKHEYRLLFDRWKALDSD
jgi:hypothetical protein